MVRFFVKLYCLVSNFIVRPHQPDTFTSERLRFFGRIYLRKDFSNLQYLIWAKYYRMETEVCLLKLIPLFIPTQRRL